VLRAKAKSRGIDIEVDSAGTIDYHQDKGADSRAVTAGEKRDTVLKGSPLVLLQLKTLSILIIFWQLMNKTDVIY